MRQAWIAVIGAGMLWTAVQGSASGDLQEPPAGTAQQGRGAEPQRGTLPPGRQGGGQRANFPQQQRPPGDPAAIARGKALYGVRCGACHGADLRGLGPVPGIAGRSPSYLTRQMFDMQAGARRGEWTELMKPVVANLSNEDLVNIAAYVSSLMPTAATSAPQR